MNVIRAALKMRLGHPYIIDYQCLALFSINERLAGKPGIDLPTFDHGYIEDIFHDDTDQDMETSEIEEILGI